MRSKIISSLEKCFHDDQFTAFEELKDDSILKNEIYSFQVCYNMETVMEDKQIVFFPTIIADGIINRLHNDFSFTVHQAPFALTCDKWN